MSEDAVMNMAIDQVFQEVRNERLHQDLEWGGPGHDDAQPMGQFLEYIERKLCRQAEQDLVEENYPEVRRRLIQIAALAVAAVESLDRQTRQ